MSIPIQKEHELICQNCGCVLGQVHEPIEQKESKMSVNVMLLGSAMHKDKRYFSSGRQQLYEENVLRRLLDIAQKYSLPEALALETFQALKRRNRGFSSEKEPIKQLIKILSRDENYIHFYKMKALQSYLKQLEDDLKG